MFCRNKLFVFYCVNFCYWWPTSLCTSWRSMGKETNNSLHFLNWGLVGDHFSSLRSGSVVHGDTNILRYTLNRKPGGPRSCSLALTENRTIAPLFSSPWHSHYSNCLSSDPTFSTGVKMNVSVKCCHADIEKFLKMCFSSINVTNLIIIAEAWAVRKLK